MEGDQQPKLNTTAAARPAASESAVPEGRLRNGLIFGSVGLFAAIVFGLLYIFVISPSAPAEGAGWSVGWFLFSFAAGLTMIVLPCTLPLAFVIVPLSMGKGMLKGISMAIAFGVGITVTLSLYGVAAAVLGSLAIDSLGTDLEVIKNWVYTVAGLFALIFALSEIGLLNVHMPTYSGAAPAFIQKRQEIFKAFLLGLFLGNIGIGCPHPATPLILIEIASSGDVLYGWLMFLVHAIGRVLPLILLAFLAILGVNGLNWLLARKSVVEKVTGWAMVFVAGFILTLGLFTHDWWVNSGIHTQFEVLTQESKFNEIFNRNLETEVAHLHGLEDGTGLFGQPLEWGHWFLVFVWLLPIWWWWSKRRKELLDHPSYKLKALEKKIDSLEKERRQVESMVDLDEIETTFDLSSKHAQLDALEAERRKAEEAVQYGETGELKSPIAQNYEFKILNMHRNYLFAVSVFLALTFIYFMPTNFYLKSVGGGDHHGAASSATQSYDGIHAMADGTVMNGSGEVIAGAHMMPDGSFMLADGTTIAGMGMHVPPGASAFTQDLAGLPNANQPDTVTLTDGDSYDIVASYVKKEVGNRTLRMLAYNGSVPGPFIKAGQGDTVTINFTNNTDIDQTIHSHGIRIDNNFDGVPNSTQDPVKPGESFSYTITFEDGGVYWYHPHTRDDYGQEMGLYGNYLIDPSSGYVNPVNREVPLVIDDILIDNDRIANFYKEITNFALLGRIGNEFLVNGEKNFTLPVETGEVIRFFVTNVSNARTYNLSIPGAKMKRVGADVGLYEREEFVNSFLISPAERMIVEVYFEKPGTYSLIHTMPSGQVEMTRFAVTGTEISPLYAEEFNTLHTNESVVAEMEEVRTYMSIAPQKRLLLSVDLMGMVDHSMHTGHAHDTTAAPQPTSRLEKIQWEDPGASDAVNTTHNVTWKLVDQATGKVSMDIPISDWTFRQGDLVKIRLTNDANAAHVMQHPIHMHGQRFAVLSENGVPNNNLVWKDTVLVFPGETVDILADMSNLGVWMNHCHISEHLHAGMMMSFRVEDENGYATGDEYRATVSDSSTVGTGQMGSMMNTGQMNMGQITNPNAPLVLNNNFSEAVNDPLYNVTPSNKIFTVGKNELLSLSFTDTSGSPVVLSENMTYPVSVTFVKSDDSVRFVSYPGNTSFPMMQNIPGTPGFDESMPHSHDPGSVHSFFGINYAYADGDASHPHPGAVTGRTYSIPVQFPATGTYRAFVAFTVQGESSPRYTSFDVEVGTGSFNISNFGWSKNTQWWVLLIMSLFLTAPLVWGVRKYINVDNVKNT